MCLMNVIWLKKLKKTLEDGFFRLKFCIFSSFENCIISDKITHLLQRKRGDIICAPREAGYISRKIEAGNKNFYCGKKVLCHYYTFHIFFIITRTFSPLQFFFLLCWKNIMVSLFHLLYFLCFFWCDTRWNKIAILMLKNVELTYRWFSIFFFFYTKWNCKIKVWNVLL